MPELSDELQRTLLAWLEEHEHDDRHRFKNGYQAHTLLYDEADDKFVIKVASGGGLLGFLRRATLRHEYKVYQSLINYSAAPKCYGLLANRYLVLEWIDADSMRESAPLDHLDFCQKLFDVIQGLHAVGVAHLDLKKKDNILVKDGTEPVLIDFGTAVVAKSRFNLINRYLFNLGKRFDLNAWVKHKYHRHYQNASEEDQVYLHRTLLERIAKKFKLFCKRNFRSLYRSLVKK